MAWGSWTRWREACVVSAAEGWPLLQASLERRAWGKVSCWPAVSCCLNTTRNGSTDDVTKTSWLFLSFLSLLQKNLRGTQSNKVEVLSSCSACKTNLSGQEADLCVYPAPASFSSSFSLISTLKRSSQSRIAVCARASKVSKSLLSKDWQFVHGVHGVCLFVHYPIFFRDSRINLYFQLFTVRYRFNVLFQVRWA